MEYCCDQRLLFMRYPALHEFRIDDRDEVYWGLGRARKDGGMYPGVRLPEEECRMVVGVFDEMCISRILVPQVSVLEPSTALPLQDVHAVMLEGLALSNLAGNYMDFIAFTEQLGAEVLEKDLAASQ